MLCAAGPVDPAVPVRYSMDASRHSSSNVEDASRHSSKAGRTDSTGSTTAASAAVTASSDQAQFHQIALTGVLFRGETYGELVAFLLPQGFMPLGDPSCLCHCILSQLLVQSMEVYLPQYVAFKLRDSHLQPVLSYENTGLYRPPGHEGAPMHYAHISPRPQVQTHTYEWLRFVIISLRL